MNYNSVLCEALKESLIEKERADSAVTGIVKKIAEKKEALLIEAIKRERPYLSEGFLTQGVELVNSGTIASL